MWRHFAVGWACGGSHQGQKSVLGKPSMSSTIIIIGLCCLVLRRITHMTEILARCFKIHQPVRVPLSRKLPRVADRHSRIEGELGANYFVFPIVLEEQRLIIPGWDRLLVVTGLNKYKQLPQQKNWFIINIKRKVNKIYLLKYSFILCSAKTA